MIFETTQQLLTLKTWILTKLAVNPLLNEIELANLANVLASPNYWVLKTSLNKHDITDKTAIDTDGTTVTSFTWGGSPGGFINRSPGELTAWKEIFNTTNNCKPNLPNVRTAFDDMFSGSGSGAVNNRKHIKSTLRRLCTVGEQLYVIATVGGPTQTGNRGTATNPDTLVLEGDITPENIIIAQNTTN